MALVGNLATLAPVIAPCPRFRSRIRILALCMSACASASVGRAAPETGSALSAATPSSPGKSASQPPTFPPADGGTAHDPRPADGPPPDPAQPEQALPEDAEVPLPAEAEPPRAESTPSAHDSLGSSSPSETDSVGSQHSDAAFADSAAAAQAVESESAARSEGNFSAPTPFDQHRLRLSLGVGWAGGATTDWLVLGAGLGYFVLPGLELHLDGNIWVIGSPFIATLTPGVRYVFHMVPDIKPYVGAFYRRYFVDRTGFDSDAIGGRVGLYFLLSPTAYLGGGLVYEHFLDRNLFESDQVGPEITFGISF